jgi:hypothetical protein
MRNNTRRTGMLTLSRSLGALTFQDACCLPNGSRVMSKQEALKRMTVILGVQLQVPRFVGRLNFVFRIQVRNVGELHFHLLFVICVVETLDRQVVGLSFRLSKQSASE